MSWKAISFVMGADIVSRYLTLSLERPIKVRLVPVDRVNILGCNYPTLLLMLRCG